MYGRKKFEDDDAEYLPPGMKRVGYDDATQRYTFREGDDLWLGEPGSFNGGKMKWAGRAPDALEPSGEVDEGENHTDSSEPPPYLEHGRIPTLTSSDSRTSRFHGKGEWGVAVHTISETQARPTDSGPGLNSVFKEAASSIITAGGMVRRLTTKRQTKQQKSGTIFQPGNDAAGGTQENS